MYDFLCVVSLFSCGKFFFVALNEVRFEACDPPNWLPVICIAPACCAFLLYFLKIGGRPGSYGCGCCGCA